MGRGQYRFALNRVTKVYPGVAALQDVDLSLQSGEVVGLIGENGAGKSTLMKVLGGLVVPDRGTITLGALTPAAALAQGIAFVHQELNPFTNLDVAGNVLLGREVTRGMFCRLDRAAMSRQVAPILERLGTRFGPDDPVALLSLADPQLLEIARALSMEGRLLILDEPTSSLTLSETQSLLDVIADLRAPGVAELFISHRLAEVIGVADRVAVIRAGMIAISAVFFAMNTRSIQPSSHGNFYELYGIAAAVLGGFRCAGVRDRSSGSSWGWCCCRCCRIR